MGIYCWLLVDSASISSQKSDEAFFSPWSSPRVFYFPRSIDDSDQKDSVINIFSTITKNSWRVMRPSSCINSYGHWPSWQRILNSCASTGWSNRIDMERTSLLFTSLCYSFVWIIWLSGNPMIFDVFQSFRSRSSIASVISIWAWTIDKLLFWKICGFFLKKSPWFTWCYWCKCPTWTARSLVLNSWDTTFCCPVDLNIWWAVIFLYINFLMRFIRSDFSQESFSEFLFTVNSKLIDSHYVRLSQIRVVLLNRLHVFLEDKPSISLFWCLEWNSVGLFPLLKCIQLRPALMEI